MYVKQKTLQKSILANTKLNEVELNAKSNKTVYVRNDVTTTIIKRCRGKKKRGIRAIDGFR